MSNGPYPRHHRAVCGDADLAAFMICLLRFLAGTEKPARFFDRDGVEREGIAQTWERWADELGLSVKQVRRILELATRLGYIVRARRTWGRYRVIRMHVAPTDAYISELTRCVALDTKAYLKTKTAARQKAAVTDGQDPVAHLGNIILPTEGKTILPTEGNYIGDSSLTHSETPLGLAIPAVAEDAQPGSHSPEDSEEEKSMTPAPHSPPSPMPSVAGASGASMGTVTSQGLALKLRDLGVLVEWKHACTEFKLPDTQVPTNEQLAALSWCRENMFKEVVQHPEYRISFLAENWHELVAAFSDCSDAQGLNLQQYAEKPSLEFVRHLVGVLKPREPASLPS